MSPVDAVDLARLRVVYALYGLLTLPSFAWVADYPDAAYRPRLGPMLLFGGFPDAWVLHVLELLVAGCFLALLAGRWVTAASWVATGAMVLGYGFTYSLGKVDHNILYVLAPAVLAVAGWSGDRVVRGWVLRLWAFIIGLGMLAAGLGKVEAGWLDPTTQAVRSSLVVFVKVADRGGPLGDLLLGVTGSPLLWEPMDVSAVVLECALIVAVLSWLWFRRLLALLCVFHLSVWSLFGISFMSNVLAYAAFVRFGRLRWWPRPSNLQALGVGLVALALSRAGVAGVLDVLLLVVAAGVAVWFLVSTRPRVGTQNGAPPSEEDGAPVGRSASRRSRR